MEKTILWACIENWFRIFPKKLFAASPKLIGALLKNELNEGIDDETLSTEKKNRATFGSFGESGLIIVRPKNGSPMPARWGLRSEILERTYNVHTLFPIDSAKLKKWRKTIKPEIKTMKNSGWIHLARLGRREWLCTHGHADIKSTLPKGALEKYAFRWLLTPCFPFWFGDKNTFSEKDVTPSLIDHLAFHISSLDGISHKISVHFTPVRSSRRKNQKNVGNSGDLFTWDVKADDDAPFLCWILDAKLLRSLREVQRWELAADVSNLDGGAPEIDEAKKIFTSFKKFSSADLDLTNWLKNAEFAEEDVLCLWFSLMDAPRVDADGDKYTFVGAPRPKKAKAIDIMWEIKEAGATRMGVAATLQKRAEIPKKNWRNGSPVAFMGKNFDGDPFLCLDVPFLDFHQRSAVWRDDMKNEER